MKTHFNLREIEAWQEKARKAGRLPPGLPKGWSKSPVDPCDLIEVFAPLRLREGFSLRAYVFEEENARIGFVYALPEDALFPPPLECPGDIDPVLSPPVPPRAFPSPMEAIVGDGSPRAYLAASILARELREFSAEGLATNWRHHEILEGDPFQKKPKTMPQDFFEGYRRFRGPLWLEEIGWPSEWPPTVEVAEEEVKVIFHTCLAGCDWAIFEHIDRYCPGSYVPVIERRLLDEGPEGFLVLDEKTGRFVFGDNVKSCGIVK